MLKFQGLHIGFQGDKKEGLLFTTDNKEFKKGELVALIGKNGAGKTTLFDNIMGFAEPLRGEFLVEEKNLQALTRTDKARLISYVPSKFYGVHHLSVYDLVAMGRYPYTNILHQLSETDELIVDAIIEALDLKSLKDKNTIYLSDGERQIAMIGKALAQETEVIILDEPTAFLDYNNKRKILHILKKIATEENKIVFISSHDLELCFEFCSRIIGIETKDKKLLDYSYPFSKDHIIKEIF